MQNSTVKTGSPAASTETTVALVGNPNTGKTTLFNALSGLRQHVGNYPGVTVERKVGRFKWRGASFQIIDLPGTYSLAPRSPDEMVAVDVLLGLQPGERRPDVILSIVDASNLERNLYLTTQLMDLGIPVVLALNMTDLAEAQGRLYDAAKLQERLGIPVVPLQAHRGIGLDDLRKALAHGVASPKAQVRFPDIYEQEARYLADFLQENLKDPHGHNLLDQHSAWFLALRLLSDQNGYVERDLTKRLGAELTSRVREARERLNTAGCPVAATEAAVRYAWIRERLRDTFTEVPRPSRDWTDFLDRILTHRVWGMVIFLALMFLVFQAIFTGAQPLMEGILAAQAYVADLVRNSLSPGPLRGLIVDGIIEGVGSVLVFLPQIVILFGFIAILEDCGYMARAAYLMDKIMARCGLSGKSFIPLLSCFACAIPGIMATRVIEDRRDRLATILVAPLMSCSARLPVYVLMTAAFIPTNTWLGPWLPGLVLFCMYLIGLIVAPLIAWILKRTLLRGETPIFLMELPAYKWPSPGMVLYRMYDRGKAFVVRAGTIILATMIVVWALLYFPVEGTDDTGNPVNFDLRMADLEAAQEQVQSELVSLHEAGDQTPELEAKTTRLEQNLEALREEAAHIQGIWKRNSILGRMGRAVEPVVVPLGWDWRIAMAVLASFPAREVVVGTLGVIYDAGSEVDEYSPSLHSQLQAARWGPDSPRAGQPVFTVATALSLMVFFALCCQCASTLAVIRRETNSWLWPLFTFTYMTGLAYVGALIVYQTATSLGG
ncbi:MAG: ferrous iron transport protein B [Gemmatales bacterium]|nr:ferrous iron transport protein B [Gemmatales bacterium]MDW8388019.1 ferrous iron transport protein B [Gemmatales bacterium]